MANNPIFAEISDEAQGNWITFDTLEGAAVGDQAPERLALEEVSTTQVRNNAALTGELFEARHFTSVEFAWKKPLEVGELADGFGRFGSGRQAASIMAVAAHGKVCYMAPGHVVCRDAFTGGTLWHNTDPKYNSYLDPKGKIGRVRLSIDCSDLNVTQAPAILDKILLVPTQDGYLFALDVLKAHAEGLPPAMRAPAVLQPEGADIGWIYSIGGKPAHLFASEGRLEEAK